MMSLEAEKSSSGVDETNGGQFDQGERTSNDLLGRSTSLEVGSVQEHRL